MAVTDEFKQDVLEVLDEYTAQLENQSGVNATPIMPIANVDETVSMPAVKFDSDPRINSRAHPQGYYQIPVSDFYARIDALAGNVQDATDDLNDLKECTDQARLDTIEATEQAQAATDEASNVNATLIGMTVTITDRNGVSRQTKIGFDIYKTYNSRAAMIADAANVGEGKFVMIATDKGVDPTKPISADNPLDPDNATLWGRSARPASDTNPFDFLSDLDQAATHAWAEWMETYKPIILEDHNTAVADHQTATSDHSRAETDHSRAEQDHSTATTDHQTATTDHQTATSDHNRAETDHSRAEQDHSTAVSDDQTAQADHRTATNDHSRAETDHNRAENDHSTASTDHTTADQDHRTATSDHSTAVDDHETASSDHEISEAQQTTFAENEQKRQDDFDAAQEARDVAFRQAEQDRISAMTVAHCYVRFQNMHLIFVQPASDSTEYMVRRGRLKIKSTYETA